MHIALAAPPGVRSDLPEGDELPENHVRFDLAPYKITPAETAIGLRQVHAC